MDTEAVPFSLSGPRFLPGSSGSEGHLPPRGLPGRLRGELASACDPELSNGQSRSLGVFPRCSSSRTMLHLFGVKIKHCRLLGPGRHS